MVLDAGLFAKETDFMFLLAVLEEFIVCIEHVAAEATLRMALEGRIVGVSARTVSLQLGLCKQLMLVRKVLFVLDTDLTSQGELTSIT